MFNPAYDPVIQSILEGSEKRRGHVQPVAQGNEVDARWSPKGFVPKVCSVVN